jgi:glycosyl transferase family 92
MKTKGTELWNRFLAHASRARGKPTFDAEERDPKLQVAEQLRLALTAAKERGDWSEAVLAALREGELSNLTSKGHRRWFKAWASADPESLRGALAAFLEPATKPEERLASFDGCATEVEAKGVAAEQPGTALVLGSLFNFAIDPESLPLVRPWHFAKLEQILGFGPTPEAAASAYPEHLAFARLVRSRMEASGLAVRDMIDVQSLVFIAALEQDFWAGDRVYIVGESRKGEPARRGGGAGSGSKSYLSVCALYRNEAPYLREWIEFHRLVGVERFFLYDNLSSDEHLDALAPYLEDGIVTLHRWEASLPRQPDIYEHCLKEHGRDSRWIAFIDLDEFVFSPSGRPLPEVLIDFEQWPGIGVNWAVFGTSGHRTKPAGLVTENYLMRVDAPANRFIKSIVDPSRVTGCVTAHHFAYESLLTMDENHYPIHDLRTKSVSRSRVRVNHYVTKSEAEALSKLGRGAGWEHSQRWRDSKLEDSYPQELDKAITAYLPALREALAATAARKPDPSLSPAN